MEVQMEPEKTRAEQEQQGQADARNGLYPDTNNTSQYYIDAFNTYKAQNAPQPPPQ